MEWVKALTAGVCALSFWILSTTAYQTDDLDVEDYLSKMPNDVIELILSHLSMRDRLKMMIVSRRWRYASKFGPQLNLDSHTLFDKRTMKSDECKRYKTQFVRGVNQILKYFSGPRVTSLRVAFCLGRKYASAIDKWVNLAVTKGLQELELHCECYCSPCRYSEETECSEKYTISTQLLLEASRLKYLSLHACQIHPNFEGQCHSLTVLDLNQIPLGQYELQHLLSSCSNLEKLNLCYCVLPTKLSIDGPSLKLKLLTIKSLWGLEEVELRVGKLTTFEFFGNIDKISFSWVPALKNIHMATTWDKAYIHEDIARSVPQLSYLIANGPLYTKRLEHTFRNVVQLDMFWNGGICACLPLGFVPLLNACPSLQKLTLMMAWTLECVRDTTVTIIDMFGLSRKLQVESCNHMALKEVQIGGFFGCDAQMEMVIYLLERAVSLERMSINSCYKIQSGFGTWTKGEDVSLDDHKQKWITEQLRGRAVSKRAQLVLQSVPIPLF